MKVSLAILCIALSSSCASAQAIKTAADSMVAGEWRQLTGVGDAVLHDGASATGEHLTYAMSAQWDSVGKNGYFVGAGHNVSTAPWVFKYRSATNDWVKLAELGPTVIPSHNYGHTSLNTVRRTLNIRNYDGGGTSGQKIYGWDILTDTSLGLLTTAPSDLGNVAEGTCWFEDLNGVGVEGGYLVYRGEDPSYTQANIWEQNKGTGSSSWSSVNQVLVPGPTSGNYHTWAAYSKAYNVAFMGGGNNTPRRLAVVNANRTVTAVPNAPVDVRVQGANAVVDPVSGNLLVYGFGQLWQLSKVAGSWAWTQQPNPPAAVTADNGIGNPGSPNYRSVMSMPIPDYGVILYSRCTNQGTPCTFYLYKHTVSGPPPPNTPPVISILSPANGTGFIAGSTIVFTVSASDNGFVSKVDYYANSNFIGSNSASPFGFYWATVGAGSYVITAKATDNLGLETTSSPINLTVCTCQ